MRLSLIVLVAWWLGLTLLAAPVLTYRQRGDQQTEFRPDILHRRAQDLITQVKEFIFSFLNDSKFLQDMTLLYDQLTSSVRKILHY